MKIATLEEAVFEAKRFIEKVETLKTAYNRLDRKPKHRLYENPKEQGAVKRASLDLTRKLADLRAGR